MNDRSDDRAARHRQATAGRSTCATSGRPSARSRRRCSTSVTAEHVPRRSTPTCSTATSAGRRCRCRPAIASRGTRTRPTSATRRSSRALTREPAPLADIAGARVLALLGDSITTDHISPAGSIKADSPAGKYLIAHGVAAEGLQLLRRAPRQPRGDDARHVRQRPAAQPAGARHRGRLDDVSARRRA